MTALTLDRVTKSFGDLRALHEVSLEAGKGEIVAIVGPSEAGKSTTLAIAAGLEKPDGGGVRVDGRSVDKVRTWQRDVAIVFESYVLYPHLTVADNIAFPLRARHRSEALTDDEAASRVKHVAELVEIDPLLERLPAELSGGQRQRVALARALARRPRLFLFDEPIAHLDAKLRHWLRGEIRRVLHEQDAPTVWATPDGVEAMAVADEIVVIKEGEILQRGGPREIFEHPRFADVGALFGNPPMNLILGSIDLNRDAVTVTVADGAAVEFATASRDFACVGEKEVLIGIRPGDWRLCASEASALVGEVLAIEPGAIRTLITVDLGGTLVQVGGNAGEQVSVGSLVGIDVGGARVHVFDAAGSQARRGEARLAASAVLS